MSQQTIEFLGAREDAEAKAGDQHEDWCEHQGREMQPAPLRAVPPRRCPRPSRLGRGLRRVRARTVLDGTLLVRPIVSERQRWRCARVGRWPFLTRSILQRQRFRPIVEPQLLVRRVLVEARSPGRPIVRDPVVLRRGMI